MITTKEEMDIISKEISEILNIPTEQIEADKVYIVKHPQNGLTTFWIWGSELLKHRTPEYKKMVEDWRKERDKVWYGEKI